MHGLLRSERLHGFVVLVLALSMPLFAATRSNAVEFSVLNAAGNSVVLRPGETVEIEIGVSNFSETGVNAVAASIFDYDESVADFVPGTGRAAKSFFVQICTGPDSCFGGIDQVSSLIDRLDLVEDEILGHGHRVQFLWAALPIGAETTATGALDQGWDGTQTAPDTVVTFRAVGLGTTVLQIGTGYQGDAVIGWPGIVRPADHTTFTIHVVPEPGSLVMIGLGMACLGGVRPRAGGSLASVELRPI